MIRFLIVLVVTACTPSTWRPPENAETVKVQDDLIVRAESDGTISVTARVVLGASAATGFVRLRNAEIATAATSIHVRLARARAWHALAATLVADPEQALEAAKRGTLEFARVAYVRNRGVMLANLALSNHDVPRAAYHMTSSLEDSLRSYGRRFHSEVW